MTDGLTDAVRRLKGLQEEVERLKSGQDEEGEPRLFITTQERAVAPDDIQIISGDILATETAVAPDDIRIISEDVLTTETAVAPDAVQFEDEIIKSAFYNRSDAGWGSLEFVEIEIQTRTVKTVDIGSTGQKFQLPIPGDVLVSVDIEATAQAGFEIRGSADGTNILNTAVEFTDANDYGSSFRYGDAFLHMFVTDAASTGETATITIQEARTE